MWPCWGPEEHTAILSNKTLLSLSLYFCGLAWLRYSCALWYRHYTHDLDGVCVLHQVLQKHVHKIERVRKEKGKEKKCTISNSMRVCLLSALVSMSPSRCYAEQAVSSQNPWPISCEIDLCQKQSVSPHTVRRTHRPDSRCLFSAENKINCWRMKSIISR